jgi:hypothetical protein
MARFTKVKTAVEVRGADNLARHIQRAVMWSQRDSDALISINKRVGEVYNNSLRANIKDFDRDILVQFADRESILVKKGQLRRSIGVWQPDRTRTKMLAGPRTNNIGRRKTGAYSDGWYAHIVEGGDSFGRKKITQNTGVFENSMRATQQRSRKLQETLLRNRFKRYFSML